MKGLPCQDESFDAVVITEAIEHLENPFQAMREINRVLKPGGCLLLTVPNYGHIEARLNYLWRGTLQKAIRFELEAPRSGKAHPHINAVTVMELKYLLMTAGFEVVHLDTCVPKKKIIFLAPLAALVYLFVHAFWSAQRRREYHIREQMRVILGGSFLLVVSRKQLSPVAEERP